jgi:CheY-like chemotaxis protein/class 3 adenylate cyclase
MTTVLVVEDDDAIRNNLVRLLKLEGYEPTAATDGESGLQRARELHPDLVITDIGMPRMDGFELVEAMRADADLAATPVLLLTALDDKASMRRGMTAGADDFLAKPFTRTELLESLQGLLKKKERIERTVAHAVQAREAQLRRVFAESVGGRKVPERVGLEVPPGAVPDRTLRAAVLYADVRNSTGLAERLSSQELSELLSEYFLRVCEPVAAQGGQHLKFIGDAVVALFVDQPASPTPEERSVRAALGMVVAAQRFRQWLDKRFAGRKLPPFAIGIGLHVGAVTLCRIGTSDSREMAAVGEALNIAARLEVESKELGWTVIASTELLQAAGPGVQTAGVTAVQARGRDGFVEVAQVAGIEGEDGEGAAGTALGEDVRSALQVNSEITSRAIKGALHASLAALKEHRFDAGTEPLRLRGYRLLRKIGAGGMTDVFLAVRESDGLQVVLKVLDASGKSVSRNLSRFIQEYTILSEIQHPAVVRIYDQGFTDDHAYIAMEYFPGGDLRTELSAGMARARVLQVVVQVAQALGAIHTQGVIHRDLKPENVMRRQDGTIALADFGIAKTLAEVGEMSQTRHGDVLGTPYYLSPEQATGRPLTATSDLYSLGVMLYEMLAGSRPYRSDTLQGLLALHLEAPVPRLPEEHADLQPVLDRLMAKDPAQRCPSASALLAELPAS